MVCSFTIERRGVTSHFYRSKISGSQYSFLTEMAICIVERWEKSMGYRFLPECNRAQESHNVNSFVFFSVLFAGAWFVEIQTMATWRNDFSYRACTASHYQLSTANDSNNSAKYLQCPPHLSRSEVFGVFSPTCSRKEHYIVNGLNKLQLYNTANQKRSK